MTSSGLEQGLGSQPEPEARSQKGKGHILTTNPVVSDKGPGPLALQKRISIKTESNKASRAFIKRKKSTVEIHTGELRERESH